MTRQPIDPYFVAGLAAALICGAALIWWRLPLSSRGVEQITLPARVVEQLESEGIARSRGGAGSEIRVLEISDFACGACAYADSLFAERIDSLVAKGAIRQTVIDIPAVQGGTSIAASVAAHCVAEVAPTVYWSFRSSLFRRSVEWMRAYPSELVLLQLAVASGADSASTARCLMNSSARVAVRLNNALDSLLASGLRRTPYWEINGRMAESRSVDSLLTATILRMR